MDREVEVLEAEIASEPDVARRQIKEAVKATKVARAAVVATEIREQEAEIEVTRVEVTKGEIVVERAQIVSLYFFPEF